MADTGLDDSHPDFQGRIVGLVALGRPNDPSDPHGHGTHVAGSILGSGSASGGKLRGCRPGSSTLFPIRDGRRREKWGGLPLELGELFEEAYQAGARIHNNSWGADTKSSYVSNSFEVDDFVARRRDMLIVISAGNEGQAAQRLHSQTGYVDWLTIDSPASSKNALTVGASRSSRTIRRLAGITYGRLGRTIFPTSPLLRKMISGDPEALAAFSSRGPCDDHRIKPDVVAPGTDIASTKSSRAPLRNFWGAYPGNERVCLYGRHQHGGAAGGGVRRTDPPILSGGAASTNPAPLCCKATLINATRCLTGPDALADYNKLPNFHQGFGFLYLPWAIPNPAEPTLKLAFVDNWQDRLQQLAVYQRQAFSFSVHLRRRGQAQDYVWPGPICRPGPCRTISTCSSNMCRPARSGSGMPTCRRNSRSPTRTTTWKSIRLDNPPPGDYLIQISASSLLQGPQDFALVVTGELSSDLDTGLRPALTNREKNDVQDPCSSGGFRRLPDPGIRDARRSQGIS